MSPVKKLYPKKFYPALMSLYVGAGHVCDAHDKGHVYTYIYACSTMYLYLYISLLRRLENRGA